jgi:tRNA(adenine34) deaminase
MRIALAMAKEAALDGEVPIGAVLVREEAILAQASNRREAWRDPTAHAELLAIREAAARLGSWRLLGTTLYVTLEPCIMCIGAVILSRIPRVVYGAHDSKAGACGSVFNIPFDGNLNHRVDIQAGVEEVESQRLLQAFFRRLRRTTDTNATI